MCDLAGRCFGGVGYRFWWFWVFSGIPVLVLLLVFLVDRLVGCVFSGFGVFWAGSCDFRVIVGLI